VKDDFRTLLDDGSRSVSTHGVEIHAHAVDQLIRFGRGESAPLETLAPVPTGLVLLVMAVLGAAIGSFDRPVWMQVAATGMGAAGFALAANAAFTHGLFIPVVPPLMAEALASGLVIAIVTTRERAERRAIAGLFSRFQGGAVADEIWRQRDDFLGEGGRPVARRLTLTAMMSDLEGYTEASESLEPATLMTWINEYMHVMAELVEAHGGVVDDYAGDGIKANFGFPVPSTSEEEIDEQARAAIRCALAMGERMDALNATWRERGLPTGRCRVGIHTGPAVVGCIGGDRSLKLTSVGDTINTAARLEGFAKDDFLSESASASFRILVGPDTRRRADDAFEFVALGAHALKGKSEPMEIFRVVSNVAR
jgi:adenylate cyclase